MTLFFIAWGSDGRLHYSNRLPYYLGSVLDLSVCLNCVNKEQFNALCLLCFIGAVLFNHVKIISVMKFQTSRYFFFFLWVDDVWNHARLDRYKRVNARVVFRLTASKTWHRLAVQSHKNRNPAGFWIYQSATAFAKVRPGLDHGLMTGSSLPHTHTHLLER